VIAGAYLLEIIGVAIAFGNVYVNTSNQSTNHVGGFLPIAGISSGRDGNAYSVSLSDAFDTTELTTVEIASLLAPALLLLAVTIVQPHVANTVSQVFVFWLNVAVGIWASIVLLKMIMALVWYSTVASILVAPPTPATTTTTSPFPTQAFPTPPPATLDPSVNLTVAAVYFFAAAMGLVVAGSVIVFRRSSAMDENSHAPQAKEMTSTIS
jgi:hypothetical protein